MRDDVRQTLVSIGRRLKAAQDPWWILGSGAMALHGAPVEVADIDVLLSEEDAVAIMARLGVLHRATPSPQFRSALFARWEACPLPVEIMAGFELQVERCWQTLPLATRLKHTIDGVSLFMPAVPELLLHCTLFNRPKDRQRAALLRALTEESE